MVRTLVIDDEPDILDFVVVVLRRAGHDVVASPSGSHALDVLADEQFDLVVADHHMPGPSGAEVLRHLSRESPSTQLLLMSGDHDAWSREGVDDICDFLPKPFNLRDLVEAVEGLTPPTPA